MLEPDVEAEVRRLIACRVKDPAGEVVRQFSNREIARRLIIPRRYVNDIASGVVRRWQMTPEELSKMLGDQNGRCPGCGLKVKLPCLDCRLSGRVDEAGRIIEGAKL